MKIKNLFLLAALGLMATASLTSCEDILGEWSKPAPATVTPAASVAVTSITLSATEATINVGATEALAVTAVTPDNATDKTVTWSSSDKAIATVADDGVVTAVAAGTATITATANDGSGVTATCSVTVLALFSVSADTKVIFSPGNLQYNSSEATYKWRFAEHQYDYVGAWDTSTWVDLFGWGAWTGDATNPINTSTTAGDYSWADADFNQESKLADESQRGYDWRTLTGGADGEWKYLLNSRTTATTNMPDGTNNSEARYTKATVAGVSGIILFPDNYAHPAGVTVTVSEAAYNTSNKAYNTFTVDATNWSTMETAGCVFLPAAGYRNSTTVNSSSTGFYWSSTVNNAVSAYYANFSSGSLYPAPSDNRYYGMSVRLVRPAE